MNEEAFMGEPDYPPGTGRRRPPLGYQVMLGSGGLLALLAASILVAIWLLAGFKQDEVSLNEHDSTYERGLAAAALAGDSITDDERRFLVIGDDKLINDADSRIGGARTALDTVATAATDASQRAAAGVARAGFENWVQAVHGEVTAYEAGDHRSATTASAGPTRTLRETYEESLVHAQALEATSIQSAQGSVAADFSRSVTILAACLIAALAIGTAITYWLVRSIAIPVYRIADILTSTTSP